MIVATVSASLIERTRRLDCEVYFGRHAEARVANAHAAIRRAHKQLANAELALKARDALRETLGIVVRRSP